MCSPRFLEKHGPLNTAASLTHVPLIHDDTLAERAKASWNDWFKAANVVPDDLSRGLRFDSADHALDAASEGAGMLLAHDLLAYDELRTGRLVMPVRLPLRAGRAYYLAYPKSNQSRLKVRAFRDWITQEIASLDWQVVRERPRRKRR